MRYLLTACLAVVLAACSEVKSYRSLPLEEFEELFAQNTMTGSVAGNFAESLPRYRELFEENLNSSSVEGLHVDFVLMAHEQPDVDFSAEVAQSQAQVAWLLEQLNPEVTAAESAFSEGLTTTQFAADYYTMERDVTGVEPIKGDEDISSADGVISYLEKYPTATVIGGEDRQLIVFSMGAGIIGTRLKDEVMLILFERSNTLRSDVAAAKLIEALRKGGKKRGAVVFGGWHEYDFRQIAEEIQLDSTFYCAASEKSLSVLTLDDLRC